MSKTNNTKGNITPWWKELHQELDYINEPFNNTSDVEKWRAIGFTHTIFTGDMYDMRRTEPPWMNIELLQSEFKFEHLSWSFYKMAPGTILPEHVDIFTKFKQLYDTKGKTIVRSLMMMEDWKPGHYLDINGVASTNWKAGDYYTWEEDCPHTAANIGITNRYTLQITGLIDGRLHMNDC